MNYLITFDIADTGVRDAVSAAIRRLGEWGELTPQSFLVESEAAVRPTIERLQRLLGPCDAIWVFSVSAPWAGHGDPIVEDHAVALLGNFEDWVPADWDDELGERR